MKLMNDFKSVAVLTMLMLGGCTSSFEPRMISLDTAKNRLPTVRRVQAGVEFSVEEFFSPNKSRRAFDADLGAQGILPLLVRVENNGFETYRVQQNQMRVFLGDQQLTPLYAHEAANRGASRDYVWNALVNTAAMGPLAMYFGVASLGATASQGRAVNRRVEQHFERMEFQDVLLKPGDQTEGFVFFQLPSSTKRLERLVLEIDLERDPSTETSAKTLRYRLLLPTLEVR